MNFINAHIENENVKIELSELKGHDVKEYRILNLGFNTNIFLTEEQAEMLFLELDEKLHEPTMTSEYMKNELSEKEDIIFDLQDSLDNANEQIEMYQDNIRDAI